MNDVNVREYRAEAADRDAFRRLNEEWLNRYFAIEAKDRELFSDPEGQIIQPGGAIYFVEAGGETVGCCALVHIDRQTLELAKMAVTQTHQGRGYSKLLMQACIEGARARGAKRLYLETNTKLLTAIALYRSFGFKELPRDASPPSDFARVDLWMELEL